MENKNTLEVIGYSKKYRGNKEYSVKNLNFKVKEGSFHGFIGANGAGKTTTIKAIVGAYSKYSGKILIYGEKNNKLNAKKHLGYIPESARFPKGLNTFDFIYYLSRISGLPASKAKANTKKVLEDSNLTNLARKNPNNFSSGQKKKVLLAQALVHNPDVIIMDEPAANLDPKARKDFFNTLKDLQKKGKSIFISSHILAEIEFYIDSLTILDGGKVVYTGDVDSIRTTKEFEYLVELDNNSLVDKFVKTQKLKKTADGRIDFKQQKNIDAFLKYAISNKAKVIKFNLYRKTLQEIYDEKVKIGSMQTKFKDGK